jgi:hypothetical protein
MATINRSDFQVFWTQQGELTCTVSQPAASSSMSLDVQVGITTQAPVTTPYPCFSGVYKARFRPGTPPNQIADFYLYLWIEDGTELTKDYRVTFNGHVYEVWEIVQSGNLWKLLVKGV